MFRIYIITVFIATAFLSTKAFGQVGGAYIGGDANGVTDVGKRKQSLSASGVSTAPPKAAPGNPTKRNSPSSATPPASNAGFPGK